MAQRLPGGEIPQVNNGSKSGVLTLRDLVEQFGRGCCGVESQLLLLVDRSD